MPNPGFPPSRKVFGARGHHTLESSHDLTFEHDHFLKLIDSNHWKAKDIDAVRNTVADIVKTPGLILNEKLDLLKSFLPRVKNSTMNDNHERELYVLAGINAVLEASKKSPEDKKLDPHHKNMGEALLKSFNRPQKSKNAAGMFDDMYPGADRVKEIFDHIRNC